MNNAQLQRTLRLLRRTGDRGIVLDSESDEVFVLMDADAYEEMLPTKETPKGGDSDGFEDYVLDDLLEIEESQKPAAKPSEKAVNEVKKPEDKPVIGKKLSFNDDWAAEKNPILSEESLSDVPHEGEEEEKFYLEPVE
jgi:hypothetical protein